MKSLEARVAFLRDRYRTIRNETKRLCEPLEIEDYGLQSMPDASPPKWHLAHTTWFFETLVLETAIPGFEPYQKAWKFLFNSYYEALGARHPRPERGLLSRPTVREVYAYRAFIDEKIEDFLRLRVLDLSNATQILSLFELGLHHEQQHQELLLTDLQHGFSRNILAPSYRAAPVEALSSKETTTTRCEFSGGLETVGHQGEGFSFDNEGPSHQVFLQPFALASAPVTNGEFLVFINDGGYERPEFWLSDGWATVQREQWKAPLYWDLTEGIAKRYSLHGVLPLERSAPVCHVSFYEADAYARWAEARLPTEFEWEVAAKNLPTVGQFSGAWLLPRPVVAGGMFGGVWEWTSSSYSPYPGFRAAPGAVGEYNGKFMCNQMVLRGGSCFTPEQHVRATYRNFFPPNARWQGTGFRLAYGVEGRART